MLRKLPTLLAHFFHLTKRSPLVAVVLVLVTVSSLIENLG
ncbi:hypothetical protein VL20_3674 [Microcystis panniformis FACHB-1757]|uniref:Uncharacterized protein n=1 Tax=Microcystis panniformis FACHB-1757 TaxID=1638788 RepID=A0A0K1S3F2_9CHRO|nr:hypothetical protein VL20_3674 [Microcystis panniformis FACHB-1757]